MISAAAVAPANATSVTDLDSTVVTVPMQFDGFDATRAAQHGYEVRSTENGWEYAVPAGTEPFSTVGASSAFNKSTGQLVNSYGISSGNVLDPHAVPRSTVSGTCGTSTLTLYTKTSGYTSYSLSGSLGGAVSHVWAVSLSARTGSTTVPLNGLPPFPGSLNWGTNFSYNVHATSSGATVNGVASGKVTTILGSCTSAMPRDSI